MDEELENIVAKAEADARASADALSEEARQRAAGPVLPPMVADDMRRVEPIAKVTPQLEKRESSMSFESQGSTSVGSGGFGSLPAPPEKGIYLIGSIDGVIQWMETEGCEDDSVSTS
jgi:hypothetical protein